LRLPAQEVKRQEIGSEEINNIARVMLDIVTCPSKDGRTMVGLHASQIGIDKDIMVVDFTDQSLIRTKLFGRKIGVESDLKVLMNPKIIYKSSEKVAGAESCFSERSEVFGIVERPESIFMKAVLQNGKSFKQPVKGFTSRIAQHESDHGKGRRFADYIDDPNDLHRVPEFLLSVYSCVPKKVWPIHFSKKEFAVIKERATPLPRP